MENDTKERILAAALEMFSPNGYAGTNVRELTSSLGLVKSSMYKHFRSKRKSGIDAIIDVEKKSFTLLTGKQIHNWRGNSSTGSIQTNIFNFG